MEATPVAAVQLSVDVDDKIANWRPLVHWLLAIPHLIMLSVLGVIVYVVGLIVWFAVLFTKKSPPGLSALIAMFLRYSERTNSYVLCMHQQYPGFEFDTTLEDPGGYPTSLTLRTDDEMNRWLVFVKFILLIPHMIVLAFIGFVEMFVLFAAFFAVLFTGRWPEGMARFVNGVRLWNLRVSWYILYQTDQYPPFSLS